MLIRSRVCAEFHDPHGFILFRFKATDLNDFIEVPDPIRQDPLFQMLLNDGSIDIPGRDPATPDKSPDKKPARKSDKPTAPAVPEGKEPASAPDPAPAQDKE